MKTNFLLLLFTLIGLFSTQTAQSQTYQPSNRIPVADSSQIGTQVSGSNNNFEITGGLQRGQNLFHSFQDFSVPTGGSANFFNPAGNQSMITRVTGNLFSDINGLIKTNGANFLLINPNGVVFGSGVSLDIGKSLITSTANGINLVDGGGGKITFGANPNGDTPLLSIAPDVLFNVVNLNIGGGTGQISNFGTLQTTNDSQYIGLIGGNVNLNGGKILAPGGRVDIGGLNTTGIVGINSDGLVFDGIGLIRSNVSIVNGSSISVRANQTLNPVDPVFSLMAISPGSSINISANQIDLLNSGDRFVSATTPVNQALGGLDAGLAVNSGVKAGLIGNINLNASGDINLNKSAIFNLVRSGAEGTGGGIKMTGKNINITNKSEISTNLSENAIGRGGDIDILAEGNFNLAESTTTNIKTLALLSTPESIVTASTNGMGNSGKIKIAAKGNVLVSGSNTIDSTVGATGIGDSAGIQIDATSLNVSNGGQITSFSVASKTGQAGNAGNIDIKTTGEITIFGSKDPSVLANIRDRTKPLARIASATLRVGNAGKVTLIAPDKLSVVNRGAVWSQIRENGIGNSGGINIDTGELVISNLSEVSSSLGTYSEKVNNTKGTAGDINIKATGNITIDEQNRIVKTLEVNNFAPSMIFSNVFGTGNGGKITIDTPGKISIGNRAAIDSTVESMGQGISGSIKISAGELDIFNQGQILTFAAPTKDKLSGSAGNIEIKTTGNISIYGNKDNAFVNDKIAPLRAKISSSSLRDGNAGKIKIEAGGNILLINKGGISTTNESLTIATTPGDITIKSNRLILDRGDISVNANDKGGNIDITTQDLILMRRNSTISTNSLKGGDGGNIAINSPFLLATRENNDVIANAIKGQGGNVKIDAQGVFGIQFRPQRTSDSDITASSDFGRTGNVQVNTPGVDPGKNNGELVSVPNDTSNQISQVCSANNRENKLTVTGRGGLPPTANDPLTSDVVWQDARSASSQPVVSSGKINLVLVPPAVGWIFDGKGKVSLVAASTQGQPTGTSAVCPSAEKH